MDRYDALVVGSGPAGSVAALVLARGGARVALVDKSEFPRDKACGDLVGPRGVQTLTELGLPLEGPRLGDMEVVGPTGRQVLLPATPGLTYPGHAIVASRIRFDAWLRDAAIEAGAVPITGRYDGHEVVAPDKQIKVEADVVIGADGALSRVAAAAGLVDDRQALWGFAIRGYVAADVPLPRIYFWEPARWSGYPGYGWVFPGEGNVANIGIGVGARGDRRLAARAVRDLPDFVSTAGHDPVRPTLGGWLKMGMMGTVPAAGRTLLVGDAAGLVNSLQGEGISQALGSGRMAAEAVLNAGPDRAAAVYRDSLAGRYIRHATTTAPVTAWMVDHPKLVAGLGRVLTLPGVGTALAGGWGIYWNDLLDGAAPGRARRVARLADLAAGAITARTGNNLTSESEPAPSRTRGPDGRPTDQREGPHVNERSPLDRGAGAGHVTAPDESEPAQLGTHRAGHADVGPADQ